MQDLIARLRGEADIYASYDVTTHKLLSEAAEALTTAQAEAEALRARVAELEGFAIYASETCEDDHIAKKARATLAGKAQQ